MVPIRDDNPITTTPYVTYGLIALNLLVFLYEASLSGPNLEALFNTFAVVPRDLSTSFNTGLGYPHVSEWGTLLSAEFLHAGFFHVGGNMLYLWIFGNNVEDQLGHLKFLCFYLVCGVLASLCQWYVAPESTVPSLGASGAIAGVMGAYIFRFPEVRVLTFVPIFFTAFRVPALLFLGFWFVEQALYGFASLGASADVGMGGGVAYWAHAGGFVFGALLGYWLGLFNNTDKDAADSAEEIAEVISGDDR
ncbi:peptidase, S54 (rhomboid) family, putative [Synechococcus sp. PCC 7335]|uniref:rhomboid family intramembrane serine protease n=1 Tax=Synechococcus sp. (strain ATCC 29403 / PCC 7335) TaxID=91464 RepID=UPI00017EDC7F|nr:rhomboid family intramembrane serine protease [Synechococcus sp. PCC 7335]EDX87388.1 peptidase, S54 (rhomboid) family, putative [Synechococcus sp. PCC 7335]